MKKIAAGIIAAVIVALSVAALFSSASESSQVALDYDYRASDITPAPPEYLYGTQMPAVSAQSCALINADTMELLFSRAPDYKTGMASTTKIMTGLIAAEYIDLNGYDEYTVVTEDAAGIEGSSVYLRAGERIRLIDLLYAMMLASANDAAAAIALHISPTIEDFARLMNEKAADMGLENTSFENPHGLDGEHHYTTASDLAALTAIALDNELFAKVVATQSYTFKKGDVSVSVSNHNRLLFSYEGATGVKTGYTKACGRCLVSSAEKDGVRLIAVTLNAPNDWSDHGKMLDYGFSVVRRQTLAQPGDFSFDIPVVGGSADGVLCENLSGADAFLLSGVDEDDIQVEVYLEKFLYAPVKKGQVVGRACFILDGRTIASVDITACSDVAAAEYKKSIWENIAELFS